MKLKKFICLILSALMITGGFLIPVSADVIETEYPVLSKAPYDYKDQENALVEALDIDALRECLIKHFSKAKSSVDLTSFNIPQKLYSNLSDLIWYDMPEAFNVDGLSFTLYDGFIAEMIVSYRLFADTEQEYQNCFSAIEEAGDKLLYGIEGNNGLSDEYKALLIHDRLCVYTDYCYNDRDFSEYTVYGALVNRSAVCQGYTMAYMYLLRRVGIDNYYCASLQLDHAWNIVYINGIPYHVDVTGDDLHWGVGHGGVSGGVRHNYFLLSSSALYNSEHRATDYDTTPENTKYDEYFWQSSEAEFQLVNGKLYYISSESGKLICLTDKKELADIDRTWYSGQLSYWDGNFSRLSSLGSDLYYSIDDGIYKYTVSNGKTEKVYSPALNAGFNIFGFTVEDGYLICDINNQPPGGSASQLSRKKIKPDVPAAVMTGIEVDAKNGKVFYIGDSFDPEGITVKGIYSDGSRKTLTKDLSFLGFSSKEKGTKTVTVTYKDFSAKFTVTVKSPAVTFRQTEIKIADNKSVTPEIKTEPAGQKVTLTRSSDAVTIKDGKIIGNKPGKAVITAAITVNGRTYKDTVSVTVACSHSDTTQEREIPATTGSVGYTKGIYCNVCKKYISGHKEIPKLAECPHTNTAEHPAKSPTMENVGYTKGVYCNDCRKYISGHKEIPKLQMIFTDSKNARLDGEFIKIVAGVSVPELISLAPDGSYFKDAYGNKLQNAPTDTRAGTGFVLVFPDASEYTIVAPGDIDGDGAVTASDARLALRAAVGLESYRKTSPCYIAAMIESSDVLSAADARMILRAAVGLERPEEWLK